MSIWGPGSTVERSRVHVGPIQWAFLTQVWRTLGWTWWLTEEEDTDPGAGSATFPFEFRDGWLTVSTTLENDGFREAGAAHFGEHQADGLARHLAITSGAPVAARLEELVLRPRSERLRVVARVTEHRATPEDTVQTTLLLEHDDEENTDTDWLSLAVAHAIAADLELSRPVHAPGETVRFGHIRPAATIPAPVTGPPIEIGTTAWRHPLSARERGALEQALRRAGSLDVEQRPPDLDRWRERATRRAGLDAPAVAGSPEHLRWSEVFDALTLADRSAPGRDGRVAQWKLRTPGTWVLGPSEVAWIASCAGAPEPLRLHGSDRAWTVWVLSPRADPP